MGYRRLFHKGFHVLMLAMAVSVGWLLWSRLSAMMEPVPRYRLRLSAPQTGSVRWFHVGPWLVVDHGQGDNKSTREYRHLSDGSVQYSLTIPGYFGRDNAIGPDSASSLVLHSESEQYRMSLIHPQMKTSEQLFKLSSSRIDQFISPSAEYFGVIHQLPLAPLQWLRCTQLPELLTIDLESWIVSNDSRSLQSLQFIPILEVYRTSDKQQVARRSLPAMLHTFGTPLLLNDGQHLLISPTFNFHRLGDYFLFAFKTPEQQAHLASTMQDLTLFNYRTTGKVARLFKGQRGSDYRWLDQEHILLHDNGASPIAQWHSSHPGNHSRWWIYHAKDGSLVELPLPQNAFEAIVVPYSQDWLVSYVGSASEQSWQNHCCIINREGKVLATHGFETRARSSADIVIPHQLQVLVSDATSGFIHDWGYWQNRFPWLRRLPLGSRFYRSVLDLQTGQKLLTTEASERDITMVASSCGQYLMVGPNYKPNLDLTVYDLPIPPLAWWAIWLPRVAGVIPLVLVLLLWLRRKRRVTP